MNEPISSDTHIKSLTGIRFIAALLVFIFHNNPFQKEGRGFQPIAFGLLHHLNIGVTIFFVLSGFLICYNYFEKPTSDPGFLKEYLIKRFARIYPLYFFLTSILYSNSIDKKPFFEWFPEYLLNITFIKGFSEKYYLTGIFQGWSLTVEETFYLSAPLIFYFIKFKGIFFRQLIIIVLAGIGLVHLFNLFPFKYFFNDLNFLFQATFFGRCFEFFVGIWLALLYRKVEKRDSFKKSPGPVSYTYFGIFLMCLAVLLLEEISRHLRIDHATNVWEGLVVANLLLPLCICVFFFGLIKEKTFVQKVLSSNIFILLGRTSYAFYLISAGFVPYAIKKYVTSNLFYSFILLLIISLILYFFVERAARRWIIDTFLGKKV